MKRFILSAFLVLLTFSFAIAQDGINYQGAATDANGDELANQNISIRASVLSASASGNLEWEETHSATTDQFGLFNIVIGQGTNTTNGATANFDDMDWGSGNHFLKIEMDATGGTNYAMIGTTQMMAVPYALYAKNAGIDSTMLANMIGSSGGGMGGGGCDWRYPDGLEGEPVNFNGESTNNANQYVVPAGKTLYITNVNGPVGEYLHIHNKKIVNGGNFYNSVIDKSTGSLHNPIVAAENSIIEGPADFHGLLFENSTITPLTWQIYVNGSYADYVVPPGKELYIMNTYGAVIKIDGVDVISWNADDWRLATPFKVKTGSMVHSTNSTGGGLFNGYLVDEDYFANCGGGGGSSSSNTLQGGTSLGQMLYWNGSEWDTISPGTYGQHLTLCEGIPIWTTDGVCPIPLNLAIGDIWGGGVVAYILQPGDNGYIPGEVHGFVAAANDIGTQDWNCYSVSSLSSSIGDGYANTEHLFNTCVCPAANACYNLVLNGYSEWFLPSKDLLNELYINRVAIGGFSNGDYWSSSTQHVNYASKQNFGDGSQQDFGTGTHKYNSFQIRPVWKF